MNERVSQGLIAAPDYGQRADGTKKGTGFMGEVKNSDGSVSTEISVGVNIDGREVEIPTMVPTLDQNDLDFLRRGGDPRQNQMIMNKAVEHARQRMKQGLSPFAN